MALIYHILGLRRSLVLLLSIVVNEIENIKYDANVRKLFILLALMSEPNNFDIHFSKDEDGFSKRYGGYLQELRKLTLPNRSKDLTDLHPINSIRMKDIFNLFYLIVTQF